MCDALLINLPLPLAINDRVRGKWKILCLLICIGSLPLNTGAVKISVMNISPPCIKVSVVRSLEFKVMLYSSVNFHSCLIQISVKSGPYIFKISIKGFEVCQYPVHIYPSFSEVSGQ